MASKRTAKKSTRKTASKTTKQAGKKKTSRKSAPGRKQSEEVSAPPPAMNPVPAASPAADAPGHDPLRRPVILFTAVTLLVFAAIYYVYGPCSNFSRFSTSAAENATVSEVAETPTTPGGETQSAPDAATIDALQLSFSKKTVEIDERLASRLDLVARFMREQPRAKLEITGHTCNIGQHEDNDRLAQERAEAVRDLLARRGVSSERLTAVGRGEREPIASNSSEAGRILNRRVEFRVVE
ncbi:MAG: OmpA family protein [bacterium]|nr:OmpA family protein [bacterium]